MNRYRRQSMRGAHSVAGIGGDQHPPECGELLSGDECDAGRNQTVAGPASRKAPETNRYSTAVW